MLLVALQKFVDIHHISGITDSSIYVMRYLKLACDSTVLLGLIQQLFFPISFSMARVSIGTLMIVCWLINFLLSFSDHVYSVNHAFTVFKYFNWITLALSLVIFMSMFFEPSPIISLILPYRVLNRKVKKTDEELLEDAVENECKKKKMVGVDLESGNSAGSYIEDGERGEGSEENAVDSEDSNEDAFTTKIPSQKTTTSSSSSKQIPKITIHSDEAAAI